jgi:hypothetical protein
MSIEEEFEQGVYNLSNAPLLLYPYPHFFATSVLPQNLYTSICKYFPSKEQMRSLKELDRGEYTNRFLISLTSNAIQEMEKPKKRFWNALYQLFCSKRFLHAVMRRFHPYLDFNQLKKEGFSGISPRVDLVEDQEEYMLEPHTDSPCDLMTFLFYLPDDESYTDWGTSLYIPKEDFHYSNPHKHYDRKEFIEVKKFPFLPNSVLGFLRSDNSFHGVESIKRQGNKEVKRRLLIYTLMGVSE